MVRRVRQSRIYDLASQIMIMWGVLVFAGNLVTYLCRVTPATSGSPSMCSASAGSVAQRVHRPRSGRPHLRARMFVAFLLFIAFGSSASLCSAISRRARSARSGRSISCCSIRIAGLWFGYAFIAIGLGITALTLIGYFFIGDAFAAVDGVRAMAAALSSAASGCAGAERWPNSTTSSTSRCGCGSWPR